MSGITQSLGRLRRFRHREYQDQIEAILRVDFAITAVPQDTAALGKVMSAGFWAALESWPIEAVTMHRRSKCGRSNTRQNLPRERSISCRIAFLLATFRNDDGGFLIVSIHSSLSHPSRAESPLRL